MHRIKYERQQRAEELSAKKGVKTSGEGKKKKKLFLKMLLVAMPLLKRRREMIPLENSLMNFGNGIGKNAFRRRVCVPFHLYVYACIP